jgi:hypothetical protein
MKRSLLKFRSPNRTTSSLVDRFPNLVNTLAVMFGEGEHEAHIKA